MRLVCVLLLWLSLSSLSAGTVPVLDTAGFWRVHTPLREGELVFRDRWPRAVVIPTAPCGVDRIRLSAPNEAAVVPNVVRPKGFQVWNSNILAADFDLDWGDPNETLHPVRIVGSRNGSFSGKVVVGSDQAISNLHAEVGDLAAVEGPGRIASDRIDLRYASPLGAEYGASYRYLAPVERFDILNETMPTACKTCSTTAPGCFDAEEAPGAQAADIPKIFSCVLLSMRSHPNAIPGGVKA